MDLDFNMDSSFAKRLQKQQLQSPTATLVSLPRKRQHECHTNYEVYAQNKPEKCIVNENAFGLQQLSGSCVKSTQRNESSTVNEISTNEIVTDFHYQTQENKYCDDTSLRLYNKKSPGDRYIPSRVNTDWTTTFSYDTSSIAAVKKFKEASAESENIAYTSILRNELLKDNIDEVKRFNDVQNIPSPKNTKLFKYISPSKIDSNIENQLFSISPVGLKSQKLLGTRFKTVRKISKLPYKVLDAPDLQNDFYLNLVDWSSQNMLSVGLGSSAYLWSANTSQVSRLCDLSSENDCITSVAWHDKGTWLAIGTHKGSVQIWDVTASKKVTEYRRHSARVGSAAWNGHQLATGSRDRTILVTDTRISPSEEHSCVSYDEHRQEVCGLKWSPDGQYLASGGNDNRVYIWNRHNTVPLHTFKEHNAAVKALAWSPHQHGLLATGGGTADRHIKFWNTLTGHLVQSVDTGSQVCNLAWSKNTTEFVSTHGYSQNQIVVWKYPSLTQVVKLTGHSFRVLYLAMSPDGESIVTGAGDETLRFWKVFSKTSILKETKSALNLYSSIR